MIFVFFIERKTYPFSYKNSGHNVYRTMASPIAFRADPSTLKDIIEIWKQKSFMWILHWSARKNRCPVNDTPWSAQLSKIRAHCFASIFICRCPMKLNGLTSETESGIFCQLLRPAWPLFSLRISINFLSYALVSSHSSWVSTQMLLASITYAAFSVTWNVKFWCLATKSSNSILIKEILQNSAAPKTLGFLNSR